MICLKRAAPAHDAEQRTHRSQRLRGQLHRAIPRDPSTDPEEVNGDECRNSERCKRMPEKNSDAAKGNIAQARDGGSENQRDRKPITKG